MQLTLKPMGRSFATRNRAKEIVAGCDPQGEDVVLNISDVMASPSFLAQLLLELSERSPHITVEGADETHGQAVARLARQLGLEDQVHLAELV